MTYLLRGVTLIVQYWYLKAPSYLAVRTSRRICRRRALLMSTLLMGFHPSMTLCMWAMHNEQRQKGNGRHRNKIRYHVRNSSVFILNFRLSVGGDT